MVLCSQQIQENLFVNNLSEDLLSFMIIKMPQYDTTDRIKGFKFED